MEKQMKYSENGLWVLKEGDNYRIGLSEKGQDDLGEVMFVELPSMLAEVRENDVLLGVEGAKAVTELLSPLTGVVVQFHAELTDNPEKLNSMDKNDNWILELKDVEPEAFEKLSAEV
ncbi:putative aminomethyltransferase, family of glycine cleavage H protein [Carnobacterium sp. 17-4]|uniref:glycine cleavage system protein H n=1 Tax=Carnobacterium sp. (strain 17-4) TaxID=208596 RepID=UPI000205905C|nr:glycine cleavage system protein H [Carnobacterium sp. 17-4]AEB29149.1 putative aminomethyltransferase, family of glycine cleavage H protein [Carnobacterium sp. 17-4]